MFRTERWGDRDKPWYETAQVCMNGHVINARAISDSERNTQFCAECGARSIMACEHCETPIRGDYIVPGVLVISPGLPPPKRCYACGEPFPWTEAAVRATHELIDEERISSEEKDKLKQDLPDLLAETPRTQVAVVRWKRFLTQAGSGSRDLFKEVLAGVIVELAKKGLFP